ncbi:MarR family transcriptional regulator [Fictibacillus sp. b24]|uniref:MarR family winged helix-turn-helix transcriptional regulator n=1 Tax=unclassified Fictibacillus TaxID=2644029 RepID=UPI0025A0FD49|nr:MarR family transcriptional regulator [Fictibacillus sp. b24]MDM5317296.1 MarR family transcriptional regulator [Fictibacillus sp. b24]
MSNNEKFDIIPLLTYIKNVKQTFLDNEKLNCQQIEVLLYLLDNEKLTITKLADKLNISPASTSTIIERLVKTELVGRAYTERDRRKVYVSLTEKGLHETHRLVAKKDEILISSLSPLTEKEKFELTKINVLFKKLNS